MNTQSLRNLTQTMIAFSFLLGGLAQATGGATSGGTDSPKRCLERVADVSQGNLQIFYEGYRAQCEHPTNPELTICVRTVLSNTQNMNDVLNHCAAE
jgi:hypothetical protein